MLVDALDGLDFDVPAAGEHGGEALAVSISEQVNATTQGTRWMP